MHDDYPQLDPTLAQRLREGVAIPAHPLALTANRELDERRQRGLSRYYLAAGAGGLAVGVHTTQFAIRDAEHQLLRPVLELAADVARDAMARSPNPLLLVAGVCGRTNQAVQEARLARELGYQLGLLSLSAFKESAEEEILEHCRQVAREIPLFGFYLQPSVGGRELPYRFWREFADIPNVMAIKAAPFNRYQTLDIVRAVAHSDRWQEIALYTGNDDAIVQDLLNAYDVPVGGASRRLRFCGGLLGHWACWTQQAVDLLARCKAVRADQGKTSGELCQLLALGNEVTDMNAALFDAANHFRGCIAGVHEVLRRQGLLAGNWCLDPQEQMSPGQAEELERVCQNYPHLIDDEFVRENLSTWLAD